MDYEKTAASDIIQKKWSGGFGLHVQGYVYGTGRVLLCDCKKIKSGKSLSTSVSVAGESTLDSILASEKPSRETRCGPTTGMRPECLPK
jgi:hypothetical protein